MNFRASFNLAAATCILLLGLVISASAAPTSKANNDFETGIEAYRAGDMKTAVDAWTASADGGHPMAAFLMGQLYEQGRGVEASEYQSFKYYEMAAKEGQVQAGVKVGLIYRDGKKSLKIKKDYEKAFESFEMGALQFWPESQYYLADMYRRGLGVQPSRTESLRWLLLAAKKKYAPSDLELAHLYFAGDGVLTNRVTGWSFLVLAGRYAQGDESKQVNAAMDKYSQRMKPGEIDAAKVQAEEWATKNVEG